VDRVEFIKSMEEANITHSDILCKFFDQYMILYNLIENVDDIKFINSDDKSVTFQLNFSKSDILNSFIDKIKTQSMIMIYEKTYSVNYTNITENSLYVSITLM
jgi:hypothetical protein